MEADEPRFLGALRALAAALRDIDAPSMTIGGVSVIALGVPRFTADIDATVLGGSVDPETMLAVLSKHAIAPRIEGAAAFAKQNQVLLLRHEPSRVPIDIAIAWLEFERAAIARSREIDYAGVLLRIPTAEDLVIYKIAAGRPRDVDDAEKLVTLHRAEIDAARVRAVVHEFSVALEDPSRDEIAARLLGPAKPPPRRSRPKERRKPRRRTR